MALSGRSSRVLVSLIIVVFFSACSTRRLMLVSDCELKEGDTIYSLICNNGDLISFAGYQVCDSLLSDSMIVEVVFEGRGAVFHDGIINGVVADGSELVFSIDSVLAIEMHQIETGQLLLTMSIVAGLFAILLLLECQQGDVLP